MKTKEAIQEAIQERESRIRALQEKHQTNETEIQRIREQNAQWLSENTDRERLPASLTSRREQSARLTVENGEILDAIVRLESEIQALQKEAEAADCLTLLETYMTEKQRHLEARSQFDGLVESLLAMVQKVMDAGAELARRESPLLILENCIKLSGGNLDFQALLDGRIEQDAGANAGFVVDQVRKVLPAITGQTFDFMQLTNVLQSTSGNPMMNGMWARRLREHLPADKAQQQSARGRQEPVVAYGVVHRPAPVLPEKHSAVFQ